MSPRRDEREMAGTALSLVYIAGNVTDAKTAERLLTEHRIDYTLSLDAYTTGSLLGGEYTGLFFYVPCTDHRRCRALLESGGLTDTIALDQEEAEEHRGTGR